MKHTDSCTVQMSDDLVPSHQLNCSLRECWSVVLECGVLECGVLECGMVECGRARLLIN